MGRWRGVVVACIACGVTSARWLVGCIPTPPNSTEVPRELAALLDAGPGGRAEAGTGAPTPGDASLDAPPGPEAYYCSGELPDAAARAPERDASTDAGARNATAGHLRAKHESPSSGDVVPASVASPRLTPPLRLFTAKDFGGIGIGVANSVLNLDSFPDADEHCRHFATSLLSFHMDVGYSAVFYAQENFLYECARVDTSVDHDLSDLSTKCAKGVASIRLVKGSLEAGVEQPARQ